MFTVKWINETHGVSHERVFEADQVQVAFDNRPPNSPAASAKLGIYNVPAGGVVVIGNPHEGADSMAFAHGKIYVMNADGKTVSTYKLSDAPDYSSGEVAAPDKAA